MKACGKHTDNLERHDLYSHCIRRTSYRAIKPEGIRAGYMVEVQVGFCAVPIGNNQYKFLLKMRSVCVLNREVDSVRMHKRQLKTQHV